jgi:hypothetical protein
MSPVYSNIRFRFEKAVGLVQFDTIEKRVVKLPFLKGLPNSPLAIEPPIYHSHKAIQRYNKTV